LGVLLWELGTFCRKRPFNDVTDSDFAITATSQPLTLTTMIGDLSLSAGVDKDAVSSALSGCLKVDPNSRSECNRLADYLDGVYAAKMKLSRANSRESA